tara:strand:- start:854 stop:1114 length:261 start_codon:yes stop_codon:yes gene_type:complete
MSENKKEITAKLIGIILMFAGAVIGGLISNNIPLTSSSEYQPHWWIYGKNILLLLGGGFGAGIYWIVYTKFLENWSEPKRQDRKTN